MKFSLISLFAAGFFWSVSAVSPAEVQSFFEWGEYQELIDSLEPQIVALPCELDSIHCARYHNFLGVAYFGKGRVGDAQRQFRRALSYRPDIRPDSTYLSAELNGLFAATRSDFLEKQLLARAKDSLRSAENAAIAANVKAIRMENVRKVKRAGALLAASFFTLGSAIAAATINNYYDTRQSSTDFISAANAGDLVAYDRLRPELRNANMFITAGTAAAIVSIGAGTTFTLRFIGKKRGG